MSSAISLSLISEGPKHAQGKALQYMVTEDAKDMLSNVKP